MKYFLLIFLFLASYTFASAQAINGKTTTAKGFPISDVQVTNLTTNNHIHTDENGAFSLKNTSSNDTLLFTHLGFKNLFTVVDNSNEPLHIVLSEASFSLKEMVISPKINALNLISEIDIQTNPVNSSQDILRQVPGLFIGQHAGGGKAEQIFLRGFDVDHGTDVAVTVDGIPVNMVSHAHGQGYADLHFVIPETVENIDYGKGPYFANKGNFNTAGYVNMQTKSRLDHSSLKFEKGQFNTNRMLGMFNILHSTKHSSYIAAEYLSTDGTFESPQNFSRINLIGKYIGQISNSEKVGLTLTHFTSKWDASGQIPQRSVDNNTITRFGAIDDTEGGNTSRSNVLFNYDKQIDDKSYITNKVFYSNYNFELYSNFTFFLEDSINGDQIKQKENRDMFGASSEYNRTFSIGETNGNWQAGINFRTDQSNNNELSHTLNRREVLDSLKLGAVSESNFGTYVNATFNWRKWTLNPGLRMDFFDFQYNDDLLPTYTSQSTANAIASPKLNILYNHSPNFQFYLKGGKGFHSNDTRVVVERNGQQTLPAAYGTDIGYIWKPNPNLVVNTALWYLYSEQEFVYVGDAGIVEPSGKSVRKGIDLSLRLQALDWLFWSFDANYNHARAIDELDGEDYIPLAPDFTLVTGVNIIHHSGWYGSINVRHLKQRPANEDYSITAEGYTVADFSFGRKWKRFNVGFQIQNLLNTEWNETQFATESRLQNEAQPVEEIHFTPGTPFYAKGVLEYKF